MPGTTPQAQSFAAWHLLKQSQGAWRGMEWACPEHPEQRADAPGLCRCGYALIPVEDLVDRQD